MKKKFLLIILIFCFVLSGCVTTAPTDLDTDADITTDTETGTEIETTEDEITVLLEELETDTEIVFSEIEDVEFKWIVEGGDLNITGKGFNVEGILTNEYKSVGTFFKDKEFEVGLHNVAAGTVVGLTGYKKEEIVCTVRWVMQLDEEGMPLEGDRNDIEVKCGKTEEEYCVDKDSNESMSLTEAKQLSIASECGDQLKDTYMCNEYTGTWWLDLDIEESGCAPACVVNVVTKEAVINWRCTGLIME